MHVIHCPSDAWGSCPASPQLGYLSILPSRIHCARPAHRDFYFPSCFLPFSSVSFSLFPPPAFAPIWLPGSLGGFAASARPSALIPPATRHDSDVARYVSCLSVVVTDFRLYRRDFLSWSCRVLVQSAAPKQSVSFVAGLISPHPIHIPAGLLKAFLVGIPTSGKYLQSWSIFRDFFSWVGTCIISIGFVFR